MTDRLLATKIMLTIVLLGAGCGGDYDPSQQPSCLEQDDCVGGEYLLRIHAGEVNAGVEASTVEVSAVIYRRTNLYGENEQDKEDKERERDVKGGEPAYDNAVTVDLSWSCDVSGTTASGEAQLTIAANAADGSTTINDLPAAQMDGIECKVKGETIIPYIYTSGSTGREVTGREERTTLKIAIVSFYIGHSETKNITLAISNITPGDPESTLDVKVSLNAADGKPAKKGERLFDNDVAIDIHWFCTKEGGTDEKHDEQGNVIARGKSGHTDLVIAAGKAEGTSRLTLFAHKSGDTAVECDIDATGYISRKIAGKSASTPFVISNLSFTVAITDAESGKALQYRVLEDNRASAERVDLELAGGCSDMQLVHFPAGSTSITHARKITALASASDGRLFLLLTSGTACYNLKLTATAGRGRARKWGQSATLNTASRVTVPFALNTAAQLSAAASYSGKVWVFSYDTRTNSSDLGGYLNANNVSSATKLKASAAANAGDLQSLARGSYIVFAEISSELRVFFVTI